MFKKKWYVVWKGIEPGIYEFWVDCKRQIDGFEGALYKSFGSQNEATEAYRSEAWNYIKRKNSVAPKTGHSAPDAGFPASAGFIEDSLAVDAACSGNPGLMEYRGVYTKTKEEIFHIGPFEKGTNNIGEFLALVHGLALLKKQNQNIPVYSDSVNAIAWVRGKKCKTKLEPSEKNRDVFDLIERAEIWLKSNTYTNRILKWETREWGEIPADFGRK
jgi:ribonuclease HI